MFLFSYELIKKQQDEMKKVTDELENVRSQLEVANRKADEAKERNALLRAHLLDKKEAENENMNQETNAKQVASKHRQVCVLCLCILSLYLETFK